MKHILIVFSLLAVLFCLLSCTQQSVAPNRFDTPAETAAPETEPSQATTVTPSTSVQLPQTEPEPPQVSTAPTETSSAKTEPPADIGGLTVCIHTQMYKSEELDCSYHSIDGTLIQYVGADNFNEWVARCEAGKTTGGTCRFAHITIVRFVEDFQIPRDVFEFLNDNVLNLSYDYNLDAIYGGKEKAEEYYTSDRLQALLEKRVLRLFKSKLLSYVRAENAAAFSEWIEATNKSQWGFSEMNRQHAELPGYGYTDEFKANPNQVSCRTLVAEFAVPREQAARLLDEAFGAYSSCERTIDLAALYSVPNESVISRTPFDDDMTLFQPKAQ